MSDSKRKNYPQVRPKRHPGFSFIVAGETTKHRTYLLKYLSACRQGLVDDLGGEKNLSMAQIILTDRVVSKLGIIRCIEEYSKESGVFQGQQIAPPLRENYLAYSNSIRMDLVALGIERKVSDRVLTPLEIVSVVDSQKESDKETGPEGSEDA